MKFSHSLCLFYFVFVLYFLSLYLFVECNRDLLTLCVVQAFFSLSLLIINIKIE